MDRTAWTCWGLTSTCRDATFWVKAHQTSLGLKKFNYPESSCFLTFFCPLTPPLQPHCPPTVLSHSTPQTKTAGKPALSPPSALAGPRGRFSGIPPWTGRSPIPKSCCTWTSSWGIRSEDDGGTLHAPCPPTRKGRVSRFTSEILFKRLVSSGERPANQNQPPFCNRAHFPQRHHGFQRNHQKHVFFTGGSRRTLGKCWAKYFCGWLHLQILSDFVRKQPTLLFFLFLAHRRLRSATKI